MKNVVRKTLGSLIKAFLWMQDITVNTRRRLNTRAPKEKNKNDD